jgi:hypothetical protein
MLDRAPSADGLAVIEGNEARGIFDYQKRLLKTGSDLPAALPRLEATAWESRSCARANPFAPASRKSLT